MQKLTNAPFSKCIFRQFQLAILTRDIHQCTRMQSSRMRTVCCSGRISYHACPPCHACPLPCMLPCHACPPAMHAPCHAHPCHTCPPAMYSPLPCIPPCHVFPHHAPCHACLPHHVHPTLPCTPPAMHAPHACPLPQMSHFPHPVMHAPLPHMHPLWTEFLTHACENITFPQLLLLTVINAASLSDDCSMTCKQYKMIKIFTNIHHITICGLKCFDIHPRYKLILFG